MVNRSERQFNESVQKTLIKYFPHMRETTAQQLEATKALFLQKKDTFAVLPDGHGKSFTIFQAGYNGTAS